MAPTNPDSSHLASEAWERREAVAQAFEDAWRTGHRPAIENYLPADPTDRRELLLELALIEMELRIAEGEPARAEDYLRRFPEIGSSARAAMELVLAEYNLRRRRGPGLDVHEYAARFPQLQRKLAPRIPGLGSARPAAARQPGASAGHSSD